MKFEVHLMAFLVALFALAGMTSAQDLESGSKVEQAKELSSMSGRPLLAVAGEAAN